MGPTEEILGVKGDISEMKGDIKGLIASMNDLRVSIAENYLKKVECKECKSELVKTRQIFWDVDTKKTALKWMAVIVLVGMTFLAGKNILDLLSLIK